MCLLDLYPISKVRSNILDQDGLLSSTLIASVTLFDTATNSLRLRRMSIAGVLSTNWGNDGARESAIQRIVDVVSKAPEFSRERYRQGFTRAARAVSSKTYRSFRSRHSDKIVRNGRFVQQNGELIDSVVTAMLSFLDKTFKTKANRLKTKLENLINQLTNRGLANSTISREVREEFRSAIADRAYWDTVASMLVARVMNGTALKGMLDSGIETGIVRAVIDERTTNICRMMNGQEVVIQDSLDLLTNDPDDAFETWKLMRSVGDKIVLREDPKIKVGEKSGDNFKLSVDPGKLPELGIGAPPYHFRCRSTLIPK